MHNRARSVPTENRATPDAIAAALTPDTDAHLFEMHAPQIPGWAVRSSPYELATNPGVFWQQTADNAAAAPYLRNPSLAGKRMGMAQDQQWAQDIQCGHPGYLAGDLSFYGISLALGGEGG